MWKNYFKVGLATLPEDFPVEQWCRLTKQANITLNLLCSAVTDNNKSAYELTYGEFKFGTTY